ncbi:MAG: trimethylamine methyltransferase family protein [Sphingomonadaceae bacterium]
MIVRSNSTHFDTPHFRKLSDDQRDRIHQASLETLERTGVVLEEPRAVELLRKAGGHVSDGARVRIPAALVEWAVSVAPKRIVLCDRHGRRVMPLEGNNVFYGTGSDCPSVIDVYTGEHRPGTLQDIVDGIRVCDALPNIDFVMSLNVAHDVDQRVSDRHQMRAMLANTTKPILAVTTSFEGCVDVIEMAEIVAGGEDAFRRNPLCGFYINVAAPLHHDAESLQKLLFLAEKGLPTTYTPVVLRGLSGPVTLAGALALANAGELAGVVVAQLQREGAPVIISGGTNDLADMRYLGDVYAAPENRVLFMEMGHRYGLPLFGLGGCSDSKLPDQQAAAEAALSLLTETLAGSHLVHDVGYLDSGLTYSLEQLAMCDEFINWIRRFMEGVPVDDESLALDLIDELGPDGNYLGDPHTVRHFKEDWYPALLDRQNYEGWAAEGGKSLRERANEKVRKILAEHRPEPLPADVEKALDAVIRRAEAKL